MKKILITVLAFVLMGIFTGAILTQQKKNILFFGDSLTAGFGLSQEQAFPNLIQLKINEIKDGFNVVNAGLSGETSAGGLNRIDWVINQPVDIFVLELGANDGLRGLPLKSTMKNLQGILDKVKQKYPKVKIVIAGMMVPPNMGEIYSTEFLKIFPELAKSNRASLIPFLLEGVAGNPDLNQADGIHPNIEGHQIVTENVWEILVPLL